MGYDQDIYNRIGALSSDAFAATSAYALSNANKQALDKRVAAFNVDLAAAQSALATAQSNASAAANAQKTVLGAMIVAVQSTRQAMIIYIKIRDVFERAWIAAQEAAMTGYVVSDMLARVTAAEGKNSYMTPQLLAGAQRADETAATAATAATTALQDTMTAFVDSERSLWSSALIMAAIVDLQRLSGGYLKPENSDELEIPDALVSMPPVVDLRRLSLGEVDDELKRWLSVLITGKTPTPETEAEYKDKSLDEVVKALMPAASGDDTNPNYIPGLLPLMNGVNTTAAQRAELLQKATTEATIDQSLANQDLAQKKATLDAIQSALAAAKQAVGG
ncbi:hypothetical protein [Stigmatella aurantiaca]|uniref:Uncharacterized protein n=1 Tax=Stigmatella aurantiaca (strain DW4/3-1) TaxID=378806 RepID=Q09DG6_STIAD|nr:hypothetical protein [Stigmatella aurantiaca]ADO69346.1 uncharacterized protein STAUR_1542 [Stigmatella aurantiaca DW4/3-1]EAU69714.1 hypothetical protein STIAU_1518 [Stigmatella aurantiaca DW4/3-1]